MLPQVGAHYMQQSSQFAASSKDSSNQQVFNFPFKIVSVCSTFIYYFFFFIAPSPMLLLCVMTLLYAAF